MVNYLLAKVTNGLRDVKVIIGVKGVITAELAAKGYVKDAEKFRLVDMFSAIRPELIVGDS